LKEKIKSKNTSFDNPDNQQKLIINKNENIDAKKDKTKIE